MVAPADRRAAANRINAQKSTGPRTDEGKARSSMNALKHGLAAQAALLPGEDPEELRLLAESMEAHLRPADPVQRILVQRVVALAWKLRRVARAEEAEATRINVDAVASWEGDLVRKRSHAIFKDIDVGPRPEPKEAARLLADSFRETRPLGGPVTLEGRLVRLTAYELKIEGSLRATMRELRMLRKQLDGGAAVDGPEMKREAGPVELAPEAPTPEPASTPDAAAPEPAPAGDIVASAPPRAASSETTVPATFTMDARLPGGPEKSPGQNEPDSDPPAAEPEPGGPAGP